MNNQHTPGPWRPTFFAKTHGVHAADGACVATCDSSVADNEANARLIAAAPELLEALELAADALANDDLSQSERMYEVRRARAAIAKAKNETTS